MKTRQTTSRATWERYSMLKAQLWCAYECGMLTFEEYEAQVSKLALRMGV